MSAEIRIFFDNQPSGEDDLDRFQEIRVDQAIGLVGEATLEMQLSVDASGAWAELQQDALQPNARIRVEVRLDDGEFTPLVDGVVVGQRFQLSAEPDTSQLSLIVQDDSVLLNREEKVELFEEQSASDIARRLFADHNLQPEVETVAPVAAQLERVVVQRGTAMQLLRELARQHGMFVYVKPGPVPGQSVGVFARPSLTPSDLPELLLLGSDRNVERLEVDFDGLRPTAAKAGGLNVNSLDTLSSETSTPTQQSLGQTPTHDLVTAGTLLLARTREEDGDLQAATLATADSSAWAYAAEGELDAEVYGAVLAPYAVVAVAGIGHLSGEYLVSRVQHIVNDDGYRQRFSLRRNARSADDGSDSLLPAEVF